MTPATVSRLLTKAFNQVKQPTITLARLENSTYNPTTDVVTGTQVTYSGIRVIETETKQVIRPGTQTIQSTPLILILAASLPKGLLLYPEDVFTILGRKETIHSPKAIKFGGIIIAYECEMRE